VLIRRDVADRLVRAVEEQGPLPAEEAARVLLAVAGGPPWLAERVVDDVVRLDARLAREGGAVVLAPSPLAGQALARARFAVLDLETTGFSPGTARIRELACVVVAGGRVRAELEGGAGELAELFLLGEGAVLAGHNLRFDIGFLDRELQRAAGARLAAPLVDTLPLARRLLAGRVERASLAALAEFFGTLERPCHRALPDARATAEILLRLIALAEERGARTVGDLCGLARPRQASRRPVQRAPQGAGRAIA
jgi:DNA polymerase III epsilon subunit-like protein